MLFAADQKFCILIMPLPFVPTHKFPFSSQKALTDLLYGIPFSEVATVSKDFVLGYISMIPLPSVPYHKISSVPNAQEVIFMSCICFVSAARNSEGIKLLSNTPYPLEVHASR